MVLGKQTWSSTFNLMKCLGPDWSSSATSAMPSASASASPSHAEPYPTLSHHRKLDSALTNVQNASAGAFGACVLPSLATLFN